MSTVDLNADLGEGFGSWRMGDDPAMLDIVSSANVACGFHAGDPLLLLTVLEHAARRGVAIGAHVSYRDLVGFGRRYVDASYDELRADLLYQIGALSGLAAVAGTAVSYVKPHGALYNVAARGGVHADAVIDALRATEGPLALLCLSGSELADRARDAGLPVREEVFADRAYRPDGTLVDRREPGAVIESPEEIARRVVDLATSGHVRAVDGSTVALTADSICVHGDTPGAVGIATAVRRSLEAAGIRIAPAVAAR